MKAGIFYMIVCLIVFAGRLGFCQKFLRINTKRFGVSKTHEVRIGEPILYKLKGKKGTHKNKIANLQDSLIIFADDSAIPISELRFIRFKKTNIAIPPVQNLLLTAAVLFPLTTTVNNAMHQNEPYLRQGSVIVSVSCVSLYLLLERVQIKRLRIRSKNTLGIVDYGYNHLYQK